MKCRLAAAAVLVAALAGCSADREPAPAPAPAVSSAAAPADPKAALAASTAGLDQGNYTFTATQPGTDFKGAVHVPSRSASLDRTDADPDSGGGTMQVLFAGDERYVKMKIDMGEAADQLKALDPADPAAKELKGLIDQFSGRYWLRLDPAKITDRTLRSGLADPDLTGAGDLLSGVDDATREGDAITGTLDATRARRGAGVFAGDALDDLGDDAKALTYHARLDGQGRLTELMLDVPAIEDEPAAPWKITVTGYGAATAQPAPPAAQVKPMTAAGYEVVNG